MSKYIELMNERYYPSTKEWVNIDSITSIYADYSENSFEIHTSDGKTYLFDGGADDLETLLMLIRRDIDVDVVLSVGLKYERY